MHPILAVFLTGLLVTAAYSTGQQNLSPSSSKRANLAATGDAVSPTTRLNITHTLAQPFDVKGAVDQNAANQQCPPSGDYYVYTDKENWDQPFELNKKKYHNLYGRKCKAPMIEAFCTAPNRCDGKVPGTKCEIEGAMTACKLPTQKVADLGSVSNPFPQGRLEQIYTNQPAPPIDTTQKTASQITNNAYTSTQPQVVAQVQQPVNQSAQSQLQRLAEPNVSAPPPASANQIPKAQPATGPINAQTPTTKIQAAATPPQPPTQTVTNTKIAPQNPVAPSAQNTFQNPTTKLAAVQTQAAGPTTNIATAQNIQSTVTSASDSRTPAPASKPNLSTSIRNAFQGGLNATQLVNSVVNLVSTVISGGGRSSSQSVAQAVDNGARAANPRASERVATPIAVENGPNPQAFAPAQNRATSAPISSFILPENAPAVVRSSADIAGIFSFADNPIPYSDTPNEQQSVPGMNQTSPADIVAALNAPDAQIPGAGSNIPTVRATGTVTTLRGSQQQFVLNPNLAPENQIVAQNSFAPIPQPERSRSVVEVFHAVSIPNILETISRGSVDFILRLLKRNSPENTVVYTEREKDPVLPVSPGAAPLLPDSSRADNTTISGQVAQPASQQGARARNIERIAYEERLRETPVAVFADASAAHRGGTHVPMINRMFVFDSLLPVPEVNIDIEKKEVQPGPIGTVLRVLFPWFFGEMR